MFDKYVIINNQVVPKGVPQKPTIMIDKSTLESLSNDESICLGRYYHAVSTHVLLSEIGADLKKDFDKDFDSKRKPEEVVSLLSKRFRYLYRFNTDWYTLLMLSLLGDKIPIDAMAPVYLDAKVTYTPGIGRGIYLEEQQERKTLRAWADGEFSESDYEMAKRWRAGIENIDLIQQRDLGNELKSLKAKSMEDIPEMVKDLLNNSAYQLELMQFLVKLAGVSEETSTEIYNRWVKCGMPCIQEFSQYGYYCLKVYFTFWWALFSGLVGPKATHCIDLHYLYELPFCSIFCSFDKFHKKFARLLMTDKQIFLKGQDLKNDLKRIEEHVISLPEEEKTESFPFPYPPDWDDSFTSQVWRECVVPREEFTPFTEEEKDQILERHRKLQASNF